MLIPLPYEREVIRQTAAGRFYLLWRRQGRKTTALAKKALKFMMKKPGGLATFASASLVVGGELIAREGAVIESARERMAADALALRDAFAAANTKEMPVEICAGRHNAAKLRPEDVAELFERQKLEAEWGKTDNVSTEELRVALRRFRSFFDRLLSV